jgi:phosphopantetheinyl transferase (holo-ACP synthase)
MLEPAISRARRLGRALAGATLRARANPVVHFRALGNDVVDLTDPAVARHHESERFVARVCSEDERPRVATARDLWSLFAAKEAAYKALVKLGDCPGFGHRAIRVAPDLASVAWRDRRLTLRVSGDGEHVHAVAWIGDLRPIARVLRMEGLGGEGERARAVLRELVATAIGCAPGELEVVRDPVPGAWDGYGPPRLVRSGAPVDADVSLSHDGRFAAAAALVDSAYRPG